MLKNRLVREGKYHRLLRSPLIMINRILLVIVLFGLLHTSVQAESVTTSVTVGNSAPVIGTGPSDGSSSGTTPTNVGSNVTFTATATDSNNESYYIAACKTDAITPNNGAAPTCATSQTWCVSSSPVASGAQASCTYTALAGDAQSNAWYVFVCDSNASSSACTAAGAQGSGDPGSPFKVNHAPTFNTISNDGPKNPGQNVTFSTNASTLDADNDTAQDTVKLVVCKTTGISAGDCDGGASDRWCNSSLVTNNPSCAYSVPNPTADQLYNAYAYVIDSHNFVDAGANQGSNSSYTVNNIAPVVSAVTINGGGAITLTESATKNVSLTATVTDNNGCSDISTVYGYVYRSGKGYTLCDTAGESNNNYCYAEVSCSTVNCAAGAAADYTCTAVLQYHADPTDAGTEYPTENWLDTIKAIDNNTETHNLEVTTGVEVNSLLTMDVSASIGYGNLSVGQKNDPLDKTTTITATGNVGLDEELSGSDMSDGATHTIPVAKQKYALAGSTAYASGIALSTSPTEAELNCQKTIVTASKKTKDTWWGLEIPGDTFPAVYTGSNTVMAVQGETANW